MDERGEGIRTLKIHPGDKEPRFRYKRSRKHRFTPVCPIQDQLPKIFRQSSMTGILRQPDMGRKREKGGGPQPYSETTDLVVEQVTRIHGVGSFRLTSRPFPDLGTSEIPCLDGVVGT